MYATAFRQTYQTSPVLNDNYCNAPLKVSPCDTEIAGGVWGEHGGCVFKVGDDMYFVPTQQVAEDDMLYITCDAQKIEGPVEDLRSRLALGDVAERQVEDAILSHLVTSPRPSRDGESFVVTSQGKTFRLL